MKLMVHDDGRLSWIHRSLTQRMNPVRCWSPSLPSTISGQPLSYFVKAKVCYFILFWKMFIKVWKGSGILDTKTSRVNDKYTWYKSIVMTFGDLTRPLHSFLPL